MRINKDYVWLEVTDDGNDNVSVKIIQLNDDTHKDFNFKTHAILKNKIADNIVPKLSKEIKEEVVEPEKNIDIEEIVKECIERRAEKEAKQIENAGKSAKYDLQQNIYTWLKMVYPEYSCTALANESSIYAPVPHKRAYHAVGVDTYAPDLFLSCATERYHGLYIFCNPRKLTIVAGQLEYAMRVRNSGYAWVEVTNLDSFFKILNDYMDSKEINYVYGD